MPCNNNIIITETNQTFPSLISVDPDVTLLEASNLLVKNQIHRLPVIDKTETNSILHMITHYRILSFLVKNVCCYFLFPSFPFLFFLSSFFFVLFYHYYFYCIFYFFSFFSSLSFILSSFPSSFSSNESHQFPAQPLNPLLSCTIGSLGIGTYDHVVTVLADTPLIVVLDLLAARKISAVPIVDEHGLLSSFFSFILFYCFCFVLVLFLFIA